MSELKTPDQIHDILSNGERQYRAIKTNLSQKIAAFSVTGGTGRDVLSIIDFLQSSKAALQLVVNTPDTAQLARNKYNDQNYDVISKITILLDKIDDVVSDIVSMIPKQNGYLLLMTLDKNNKAEWRSFTPSQLGGLVTKLSSIANMVS